MPSPQKAISTKAVDPDSVDSDEECDGLLERDYEGTNQLEALLLGELFEHFVGFGGLLQAVEKEGGQALASTLAVNEKLVTKIGKFQVRRDGQESADDGVGYSYG